MLCVLEAPVSVASISFFFRKEPEAFARLEALPDRFFIVFAMNCQFQTEEGKYERVSMPSIRSDRSFSATGPICRPFSEQSR
jgi:hypothetical protein